MVYNDTKAVTKAILEEIGREGVTYERVREHIENSGWQIMQYGNNKCNPGNATLQTLGFWEYAKKHESLAYSDEKRSVIFLNVKRKSSSLFLLIHEIAHIKAGHTINGGVYGKDDPEAELQADKIANAVLKKANAKNPLKNHTFAAIGISVICTALVIGTITFAGMTAYINRIISPAGAEITQQVEPTPEQSPEPPPAQAQPQGSGQDGSGGQVVPKSNNSDSGSSGAAQAPKQTQRPQQPTATPYQPQATPQPTPAPTPAPTEQPVAKAVVPRGKIVWLTPKGDKYHTVRNCPSIVNRTDLTELDEADAIAKKKEKCQHCINRGG